MTNAIDLQLIADYGGTMLWPMIALSNIGMIALQRKNAEAQEVNVPAFISCYLGVTEPAIFGVNLKFLFPFVCGMAGSACAAIVCVATGTTANAIGIGGIPGILSIQPKYMLSFAVCMVIAVVVPLVLTMIVGAKKGVGKEVVGEVGKAFLNGEVIELKEVNDGVFSEGVLGNGFAIIPENEVLYAPCDSVVTVLMEESRHACGLTLANGMELLLHVGVDTVDMNGEGFEYLVKEGDRVSAGTPLIRFSREKIKAAGHPDTTVCIITSEGTARNIQFITGMKATVKETTVFTFE